MDPTSNLNQDPQATTKEWTAAEIATYLAADDDTHLVAPDMQTRHGSIEEARNFVAAKARSYHRTHPGHSSFSSNTSLEGYINGIFDGKEVTWDRLSFTLCILDYRLSITEAVSLLLHICDIPCPKGQSCASWDPDANGAEVAKLGRSAKTVYIGINTLVLRGKIFPSPPATGQGRTFPKPTEYITAALFEHVSAKGRKVIQEKVDQLAATSKQIAELQKSSQSLA